MLASFLLILVSIAFAAGGQFVLKRGANQLGAIGQEAAGHVVGTVWHAATNPWIVGGLGLYALGAVAWIVVLTRVPLSWAYPILALNNIVILLISIVFLHEQVSAIRWGGVLLIIAGVYMVSRS